MLSDEKVTKAVNFANRQFYKFAIYDAAKFVRQRKIRAARVRLHFDEKSQISLLDYKNVRPRVLTLGVDYLDADITLTIVDRHFGVGHSLARDAVAGSPNEV